jgi:primase-polymerase (primpol)-like protein
VDAVEFKSSEDGAAISFAITRRWQDDDTSFDVTVKTPWFVGRAEASTHVSGSPAKLFREMANEWKGWKNPKTWADLEDRVKLSASSDSTGHVRITVELRGPDYDSALKAIIVYEAGQLDRMATEIAELLPPDAP